VGILLYNTCRQKETKEQTNHAGDGVDSDDKMDNDEDSENGSNVDDASDDSSNASDSAGGAAATQTNVHMLLDLVPPGVNQFKTLQLMLEKTDRQLKEVFCPESLDHDRGLRNAPLQNALEEAQRIFIKSRYVKDKSKAKTPDEMDSRAIWIFTNQAEPYSSDLRERIANVAREAKDHSDVEILVWPLALMPSNGGMLLSGPFESLFFDSLGTDVFEKRFQDFDELQDNGLDNAYVKKKKHRRSYYLPLHILRSSVERDPPIMVEWYTLVQLAHRPSKVSINDETKQELIRERKMLEKDTGIELATFRTGLGVTEREEQEQHNQAAVQRIRQFHHFVNTDIPISQEDMKSILTMANGGYKPGLTILGFKPRHSIPFFHSIAAPYLIYPSDADVQGSVDAFARLHASMLRKNVLAIGEVLFREYWQSSLVALSPLEKSTEEREAGKPAGMLVTLLPFEDDLRAIVPDEASKELDRRKSVKELSMDLHLNNCKGEATVKEEEDDQEDNHGLLLEKSSLDEGNIASEELVEAAIKMISRRTFKSDGDEGFGFGLENEMVEDFYAYLKNVALDLPHAVMEPTKVHLPTKAKKAVENFFSLLPDDVPKKKATTSRKRAKELPPDETGIDWKHLFDTDNIQTCKNDELKARLRSRGLPVGGAKNELVAKVKESIIQEYS
jgi:ATP-dependent DNA helicase 2 subunit 1